METKEDACRDSVSCSGGSNNLSSGQSHARLKDGLILIRQRQHALWEMNDHPLANASCPQILSGFQQRVDVDFSVYPNFGREYVAGFKFIQKYQVDIRESR